MARMLGAAFLALALCGPAQADKAYQGDEMDALVCVYLFNTTATLLEAGGQITPERRDNIYRWSQVVLTRYVGGSDGEKAGALHDMANGRDAGAAIAEFEARGRTCLAQFPI